MPEDLLAPPPARPPQRRPLLLAVESVPTARAAMGSGARRTFGSIGSCAGVVLTVAIATSTGSGLAHGADIALAASAGLAAVTVVVVRERA